MTVPAAAPLPLAAVLLAGGASRRFGVANKLVAQVGGTEIIRRVVLEILGAGVADLVVVTGAEHAAYLRVLEGLAVRFVENPAWTEGMGGTIAAGVRAVATTSAGGVFIVPADLPNLDRAVLRRLAECFTDRGGHSVVVPVLANGEQRNPVLWPRSAFPKLASLSGHTGGKSLLDTMAEARLDVVFEVADPFVDVDTPGDLERFIAGSRP